VVVDVDVGREWLWLGCEEREWEVGVGIREVMEEIEVMEMLLDTDVLFEEHLGRLFASREHVSPVA
jgi:hypothetical protein